MDKLCAYEKRTLKTALKAIKFYKNNQKDFVEKVYLDGKINACIRILLNVDLATRIDLLRDLVISNHD